MAVLAGDPSKDGNFTIRAFISANFKLPAQRHIATENLTVIKGTQNFGKGDKLDEAKNTVIKQGGFVSIPSFVSHYAFTKGECIIEVHSVAPFLIKAIKGNPNYPRGSTLYNTLYFLFEHPYNFYKPPHVVAIERGYGYAILFTGRRMNKVECAIFVIGDDAHVPYHPYGTVRTCKKDKVAGPCIRYAYGWFNVGKIDRRPGYGNIKMIKNISDKAGAIEAF